ncbi:MAG: hypothetical protein ACK55I_29530 [bacterium]
MAPLTAGQRSYEHARTEDGSPQPVMMATCTLVVAGQIPNSK